MNTARSEDGAAPQSTTVSPEQPWPGLLSFREIDREYFHGRQSESEELFRLVARERLTILFGLSGLGKSSLLQAGLFPMLRRDNYFPIYLRLDLSSPEPNLVVQTTDAIRSEAVVQGVEAPRTRTGETLWEYFHRNGHHFWSSRNRPLTPVLVFDQFEEIFTLGRTDPQRSQATDAFTEQLGDLAEARAPAALKAQIDAYPEKAEAFVFGRHQYKVLLAIREDFLPELESLRNRIPSVALNRLRLQRMNGTAALTVVAQAAHLVDHPVAEAVVRFVAADRQNRPLAELEVEPALLSVVCRELNNKRLSLGEPRITASLLEGAREQVLSEFYDRSMSDLTPEIRYFVEDKLLTVSGYRDSVALENALSVPGITRASIDELVERRIIRREDRAGSQRLELTHDLLAGVVRESRDGRRKREEAERERLALLRTQQEEKLQLQRASEEQERRIDERNLRRFRFAAVVFLVLTLVAGGAAVWAIVAQRRADLQAQKAIVASIKADAARQETVKALKAAENAKAVLATAKAAADENAAAARRNQLLAEEKAEEARLNAEKVVSETKRANELADTNARLARILRLDTDVTFGRAQITPEARPAVERLTANLVNNRKRYEAVSALTGVPWYAIAVIHLLEDAANFNRHLHNGDPLTNRTVHVPVGRPATGNPPFTWEESAADAIRGSESRTAWKDWSIPGVLIYWEQYNSGTGYRRRGARSPYVWACTDQYLSGKYTAEGTFDPNAVSKQCGGAALLKRMIELKVVSEQ